MSTHIALLRGINVGGHNLVAMSELCDLFIKLGFTDAKSLLQSGNVVFKSKKLNESALESLLEKESRQRFGIPLDYIVRSAGNWREIVARNPFSRDAQTDPAHLLVMFLKKAPSAKAVDDLRDSITGPESLHANGKQLYLVYPAGVGRSKLTVTRIERALSTRGTARNWNTILKLLALCDKL